MTVAYATADQLAEFLGDDVSISEPERLLKRASEVLDAKIRAPFAVDDDTSLPEDADLAQALADACCAQVEFWAEVGEDHDVSGLANRQVSIGHLSVQALPPELAPRALRFLAQAGLTAVDPATPTVFA